MSNLLDKLTCEIKQYKDCSDDERGKILKLLRIAFGPNNDPYLLQSTTLVIFYYKSHVVAVVSGMENYDLVKHNEKFKENRDSYYINYDKRGVFVYNLAVLGSCRGHGLGKCLVKLLIDHFRKRGVEYFHVQINEDNGPSMTIFEKIGFKVKKTLKNSENNNFNLLALFVA
jgi:ribosomal protein S18 acetylase RimI-like enzyme